MVAQDKPGRGDNRALMWLGHHSVHLMVVAIGSSIAEVATGNTQNVVGVINDLAWIVWTVSLFAGWNYHDSRLCERCVAATPLDTQAAVDRWRPALRWEHRLRWRLAVLIVSTALLVWTGSFHPEPWWGWLAVIPAILGYSSIFISAWQHRRLYPWCPFCRWDDGGDEEVSPDVPAPTVSR